MKIYQHQSKIHLRIKIENVNQYQPMPKSININQDQYRRQSIPIPISINTNKLESTSFSNNLDQYQNQINIKINISVKSISISQFISVSKLMSMSISISITINTVSISINQNKANQWIKALLDSDFVFTICLAFDCSWKCPARQDITTLLHLKLQYPLSTQVLEANLSNPGERNISWRSWRIGTFLDNIYTKAWKWSKFISGFSKQGLWSWVLSLNLFTSMKYLYCFGLHSNLQDFKVYLQDEYEISRREAGPCPTHQRICCSKQTLALKLRTSWHV